MEIEQYQQPTVEEECYLTRLSSRRIVPEDLSGAVLPNGGGNGGNGDDDDKYPKFEYFLQKEMKEKEGYKKHSFNVEEIFEKYLSD